MKYQANPQASQNVLYTTEVWSDAPVEQDLARLTVDHFVSLYYLPYIQPRKRSWAVDKRISRQYISLAFGARALACITRREVEQWMEGLLAGGLAAVTCNRILAVFKSICTLAVRVGIFSMGMTPCTGVQAFKEYTLRERYLSPTEAQKLMRALLASNRIEALVIRLLLLTGARKSEILTARWEYIRLDLRLLIVPLSKSGKPRHIPLSDEALAIITSLQRIHGCPWLFPGHNPEKPLSDVFLFWKQLRQELGIPDVRIHDLRHTFASCLVNAGHSLYEVQKILGHSDPKITMRYAHLGQESLLAAAEVVSSWLFHDSRKASVRHTRQGKGHSVSAHSCSTAALCSS
jgi:integrase